QTDARATAPRAKDQNQLATQPSALPQAPLRSPHIPKADHAPHPLPKPPAVQPQAAQGRSCAGSRGAQQHPQAQLPAHPHPARREAEPPAGSCSGRRRPPAAPKTTADAAHTTAAPRQDAQPPATPASPTRSTSPATVGASNRLRIETSTPRLERMRLIRRVASSEWPPSAKKSSSIPTRSNPKTSANNAHSNSSRGLRAKRATE